MCRLKLHYDRTLMFASRLLGDADLRGVVRFRTIPQEKLFDKPEVGFRRAR